MKIFAKNHCDIHEKASALRRLKLRIRIEIQTHLDEIRIDIIIRKNTMANISEKKSRQKSHHTDTEEQYE